MSTNLEQLQGMRKGRRTVPLMARLRSLIGDIPFTTGGGKEAALFARQLATMINAGLPVVRCIETLSEQSGNDRFKKILDELEQKIKGGYSLSEALKCHKCIFGDFFVHMAEVGETGGQLGSVLERVATYLEKSDNLKRKLRTSMTYPALVVAVAAGSVGFLMTTVVPTFSDLFAGFEAELPGPTAFVIAAGNLIKEHFGLLMLVCLGGAAGSFLMYRQERVRYVLDGWMLHIPVIGNALRKNVITRFARSLGTLLGNGITIVEALDITARTVGNRVMARVVERMSNRVRDGQSLVEPLKQSGIFTPMTVQMVAVGEESGKLGEMLTKTAEFHEAEVDAAIEQITSLIEPVIIIVLGVVLGAILIAMYLPMFELMEVIK